MTLSIKQFYKCKMFFNSEYIAVISVLCIKITLWYAIIIMLVCLVQIVE